jgi:hypothetical protein
VRIGHSSLPHAVELLLTSVVLDRKVDKNADVGQFELAYRQPIVAVPPYIGISLQVEGHTVRKAEGGSQSVRKTAGDECNSQLHSQKVGAITGKTEHSSVIHSKQMLKKMSGNYTDTDSESDVKDKQKTNETCDMQDSFSYRYSPVPARRGRRCKKRMKDNLATAAACDTDVRTDVNGAAMLQHSRNMQKKSRQNVLADVKYQLLFNRAGNSNSDSKIVARHSDKIGVKTTTVAPRGPADVTNVTNPPVARLKSSVNLVDTADVMPTQHRKTVSSSTSLGSSVRHSSAQCDTVSVEQPAIKNRAAEEAVQNESHVLPVRAAMRPSQYDNLTLLPMMARSSERMLHDSIVCGSSVKNTNYALSNAVLPTMPHFASRSVGRRRCWLLPSDFVASSRIDYRPVGQRRSSHKMVEQDRRLLQLQRSLNLTVIGGSPSGWTANSIHF